MSASMLAVLGPGGVGGFLAGALERAGEPVVVVAREPTARVIERDGLRVSSERLGDFTAAPRAVASLDEEVGVLFVASKAPALAAALERIDREPGLVVPLLNGLDHLAVLRDRFSAPVIAGSIRIEADRPEPGVIVQTSPFLRIDLASDDPSLGERVGAIVERLNAAEVPAQVLESEAQVIWSKLVRLNALACTTSAADRPIGFIRTDPQWRRTLERAVAEGVAVGHAEGARVDSETVMGELDAAHETLGSSMQRDIAAGRTPELDAIPGAVLRAARRHGIAAPTIEELTRRVANRAGEPMPSY
jgi:2-dehydropantoate 2-reductase